MSKVVFVLWTQSLVSTKDKIIKFLRAKIKYLKTL